MLTFEAAAIRVLEEAGSPLHTREIAERALEAGLIATSGKTPAATIDARLAVSIKAQGVDSPFVRVGPSTFGLQAWVASGKVSPPSISPLERRVRVPHFPDYAAVRAVLPVWAGRTRSAVTGLRAQIDELTGSPQAVVDWARPDDWIPARLTGEDQELALAMWKASRGTLNPRYMIGHWLLASSYELLVDGPDGLLRLTERGRDFVDHADGAAVRMLDEAEGLVKILGLVAESGSTTTAELREPWRQFLDRHSRIKSDLYARATLNDRLANLVSRSLVERKGRSYTVTPAALAWLREAGVQEDASGGEEEQDIRALITAQQARVRERLLGVIREMDPFAFERLIAQLLEEMGYTDVQVTSPTGDKGVDVVASIQLGISSVREVVQAKRHKANIHRPVLDALRGSLHRFRAVRATIISTGDFAKGTQNAAFEIGAAPITLINGEKLVDLLIDHGLGVRKREVTLWELDLEAFEESGESGGGLA